LQEFSRQKMGTQLCLAGRDETVARLRKLADQSGFREEEIQTYSVGRRKITLFCAACQHLTETMQCEQASCGFCGRLLNVTPHYSRRLDAYLGYIGLS
ncbi:hypothetical protein MXD63_42340, partial [Frankia sp. Cpl3]|nr:hypothetical protein [Frankia sp. Cpl3]